MSDTVQRVRAFLDARKRTEGGSTNILTVNDAPLVDADLEELLAAIEGPGFQDRVSLWMDECFTPEIKADKLERADRFIEEALELVQATGYSAKRAHALVDYVFGRAVGDPDQEVGGVMVTLAALCGPNDLRMYDAAERELARIIQPDVIKKIRSKQASKPVGSALP